MILEKMVVGDLGANCYILACERTKMGIIIDPGGDGVTINEKIEALQLKIKWIINTHGHVDHIGANQSVKDYTGAALGIHETDAPLLTNPEKNLSAFTGLELVSPEADFYLKEGETLEAGDLKLEIIHTPGHTPGCVCLTMYNGVFSGDTLFMEGIGRCDLPGGDQHQLLSSVQEKLFTLDEAVKVYPGHGEDTTIGHEKGNNPFFSNIMDL